MTSSNADLIRRSLSHTVRQSLAELVYFREIASTNSCLLERQPPLPGMMSVAIAEHQTAGRGRRDKEWYSPSRSGLWMSVAYSFKLRPKNLPALTLAVGATLADELGNLGAREIGLKWPNDLMVGKRKLGGILVESSASGMTAVVGTGINLTLPDDAGEQIKSGNEPVDLKALLAEPPSLEQLATLMLERLCSALQKYDASGFESFVAAWSRFDTLAGLEVTAYGAGADKTGLAQGIADDGALLLKNKEGIHRIVSGSVQRVDCEEAVA